MYLFELGHIEETLGRPLRRLGAITDSWIVITFCVTVHSTLIMQNVRVF